MKNFDFENISVSNSDKKAVTIVMKKFQRQKGSIDCGLFIAVMVSLHGTS